MMHARAARSTWMHSWLFRCSGVAVNYLTVALVLSSLTISHLLFVQVVLEKREKSLSHLFLPYLLLPTVGPLLPTVIVALTADFGPM